MPNICDDCGPSPDPIVFLILLLSLFIAGLIAVRTRQWTFLASLASAPFVIWYLDEFRSAVAVAASLLMGILVALVHLIRRQHSSSKEAA
jgi:hypothetical protein